MDNIEHKLNNLHSFTLNELLIDIHCLLNTLNITFNINQYISIVNTILSIPTNDSNWNISHELFDISLLGCIMYIPINDLFWAKWVYNKLLWKKNPIALNICNTINNSNIDYIEQINKLSKINQTVNALYTLRLIFVKDSYDTEDEIVIERTKVQKALIILNSTIENWINDPIIEPLFYNPIFSKIAGFNLSYHNCNNALLLHQYGIFYRRMLQKLYESNGGVNQLIPIRNRIKNTKKRIGFASRFLFQHSVGKVIIGIIEQLYLRNEFDIYIFTGFEKDDPYCNILKQSCHKFICFNKETQLEWIQKIKNENIDILIFVDPLMDINLYILASFNIVPIQIATWGHPDTTGLPSIDYFISSKIFEKYSDNNYTEELITFNSMNYYFYNPNKFLDYNIHNMLQNIGKENARKLFNFPIDKNIYAISCLAIKISPIFEKTICKLLENDPNSILIMTEDINSYNFNNIKRRFNTSMPPNICNRIHTVSFINDPKIFYQFIYSADVILDPFPFGGLISTIDMFSCGRTIITLPGEKLYGRFTSGLYKVMGLTKTKNVIAQNIDDYIEKAILLANCSRLRESIENEIIELLPNIFEDKNTIDEWSTFLHSLT